MTLDQLRLRQQARITAIAWDRLSPDEGQRLRSLGIEVDELVEKQHQGMLLFRDPIAVTIGRMQIALRRTHAAAIEVEVVEPI
jgi:ferrous iron transport protein A